MALPGDGGIRTRSVAILVADGVDGKSVATAQAALRAAGTQVHLIAPRLGPVKPGSGEPFEATGTLENSPPVLFDGVVLPDGDDGVKVLGGFIEVMDFISNQHRHGKTLLALGKLVERWLAFKFLVHLALHALDPLAPPDPSRWPVADAALAAAAQPPEAATPPRTAALADPCR